MVDNNVKSYVGIDVSKETLDICILPKRIFLKFDNTHDGVKKLTKKISSLCECLVVLEPTGGYEKLVIHELTKKNIPIAVINPRQIRNFAKAIGILAKTDRIDSEVIALFAEKLKPEPSPPRDLKQQQLIELNVRRRQIIDLITIENNRLDKASKEIKRSIENIIKLLQKELNKINEQLKKIVNEDAAYSEVNTLLQSIKGVGPAVSIGIIAELPEIGNLNAKKISALVGVAPLNRDSGKLRGKRSVWGGRTSIRRLLYMAALVATKHNPTIKSFYKRLCSAGKVKKVALVACMHKLLIIMNAMIKNKQQWMESKL